jgi:hypothetical protein
MCDAGLSNNVDDLGTVVMHRRLPVRMEPFQGEAIDAWLEATARPIQTTVSALARAVDLPVATRPPWIRWLSPYQLETIEVATDLSSEGRP